MMGRCLQGWYKKQFKFSLLHSLLCSLGIACGPATPPALFFCLFACLPAHFLTDSLFRPLPTSPISDHRYMYWVQGPLRGEHMSLAWIFKYGHYFCVSIRSRLCPCRYLTHLNVFSCHFIQSHVAVSRPCRLCARRDLHYSTGVM